MIENRNGFFLLSDKVEMIVSGGLGLFPLEGFHAEESLLNVQTHLARLEKNHPSRSLGWDPDIEIKLRVMDGMLRNNCESGEVEFYDSVVEITEVVNQKVRNRKSKVIARGEGFLRILDF